MKNKLFTVMSNKILKKILAIMLILLFTVSDVMFLGIKVISYASAELANSTPTNDKNVTFDVYFKQENGNTSTASSQGINSDNMKLYMQISVGNEGYFNGKIEIQSSNFRFKEEKLSEQINKIDSNKIVLNQLNSGGVAEIEVGIEALKDDKINLDFLAMKSQIKITGEYTNSSNRNVPINATREVQLVLENPYEQGMGATLTSEVLTNHVYNVDGTNKRIVQMLITSGLEGNGYPVKESKILLSKPEGVESMEVWARQTKATNGKGEQIITNESLQEIDGNLEITLHDNAEDGKISWNKTGKDELVVTYVFENDESLQSTEVVLSNSIELYDQNSTQLTTNTSSIIDQELDQIVTYEVTTSESSIYKGKIYSGEDRSYVATDRIFVNTAKATKEVKLEANPSVYTLQDNEAVANIQYTSSIINKKEVIKILGEDGALSIYHNGIKEIAKIDKDTQADENGNVTITYTEGITAIKISTTEPVQAGTISIENVKTIKSQGYDRSTISALVGIKESVTGAEAIITLQETSSEANLQINKESLSTIQTNENVEIKATLKTDGEQYDLYKNPTINITFPSEIKEIKLKSINPAYLGGLTLGKSIMYDNEVGQKVISIKLQGEQTSYTTEMNNVTIVITADLIFDMLETTNTSAINMTYTNETTGGTYGKDCNINIESKYGLMLYNGMSGYNKAGDAIYTINDDVVTGSLDFNSDSKTATVKGVVINNYDTDIQDVTIVGKIPTENINNGSINTSLLQGVLTDKEGVDIKYSSIAEAGPSDNTWGESQENAKAFKIYLPSMAKGQMIQLQYLFNVPEKITFDQSIYESIEVFYTHVGNSLQSESVVGAKTEGMGTSSLKGLENIKTDTMQNGLAVTTGAMAGEEELANGDSVYEGQSIKYTVVLTNTSNETLTNVSVKAEQENANIYDLVEVTVEDTSEELNPDGTLPLIKEHRYDETDTNIKDFGTIETIGPGQSFEVTYEVVVKEVEEDNLSTGGQIIILAEGKENETVSTISNKILQAELKLNLKYVYNEEVKVYSESTFMSELSIENLSNVALRDVEVEVKLPEILVDNYGDNLSYDEEQIEFESFEEGVIKFKVLNIDPGEDGKTYVSIKPFVKEFSEETARIAMSAKAITSNKATYVSNELIKEVQNSKEDSKVSITQAANFEEGAILKDKDNLVLTAYITNDSDKDYSLYIQDGFQEGITINKVTVINNGEEKDATEKVVGSFIGFIEESKANSQIQIIIDTTIDRIGVTADKITNMLTADVMTGIDAIDTLQSNELTFGIEEYQDEEEPEVPVDPDNPNPPIDPDNPDKPVDNEKYTISGVAWLDANSNGLRETSEELLEGIEVGIIDTETGDFVKDHGQILTQTTNANGAYEFELVKGSYMVAFFYDANVYALADYKKSGVTDGLNSDVITSKGVDINGENKMAGLTDELELAEENQNNIDIGLKIKEKFDLRLDKYVSKVTVQNRGGTNSYSYNDEQLAKVEIKGKYFSGSLVLVEYKINITNEGDVGGYINDIVDYLPSGYKFSSELNTSWYINSDGNLHNTSLANTEIAAGETKSVTLVLTKTLTENDAGRVMNTAELGNVTNSLAINDIDSTPGNKAQGEDDISTADLLISVSTGLQTTICIIAIIITLVLMIGSFYIMKKEDNKICKEDILNQKF